MIYEGWLTRQGGDGRPSSNQRVAGIQSIVTDNDNVQITRVRDDRAGLSPLENWLLAKDCGNLDVRIQQCDGTSTTVCLKGYACSLQRPDLRLCGGFPTETLTIRLVSATPAVRNAPLVQPRRVCARIVRGETLPKTFNYDPDDRVVCISFTVVGGSVSDAAVSIRNVLPFPGDTWLLIGGPAPGTLNPSYTSPNTRKINAYRRFASKQDLQNKAGAELDAFWRCRYDQWHEETRWEVVFNESFCQVHVCLEVNLPPFCVPDSIPGVVPAALLDLMQRHGGDGCCASRGNIHLAKFEKTVEDKTYRGVRVEFSDFPSSAEMNPSEVLLCTGGFGKSIGHTFMLVTNWVTVVGTYVFFEVNAPQTAVYLATDEILDEISLTDVEFCIGPIN